MGQPGDLLLIFADALIRSWKQITKFQSATSPASISSAVAAGDVSSNASGSGIGGFMTDGPSLPYTSPTPVGEVKGRPSPHPSPARAGEGAGQHSAQPSPAFAGEGAGQPSPQPAHAGEGAGQLLPGLIRDERGVWLAPELED